MLLYPFPAQSRPAPPHPTGIAERASFHSHLGRPRSRLHPYLPDNPGQSRASESTPDTTKSSSPQQASSQRRASEAMPAPAKAPHFNNTLGKGRLWGAGDIRPVEVSTFGHFRARRTGTGGRGEGEGAAQAAGALPDAARLPGPSAPKCPKAEIAIARKGKISASLDRCRASEATLDTSTGPFHSSHTPNHPQNAGRPGFP